jgi:hypothetical protein
MNRSSSILGLLVFAALTVAYAQGRPPADGAQLVEVVGCLSQTGSTWILANASDPAPATTTFTTPEAIKAAGEKPLGTQEYRLLGTNPFSPEAHKGHKMAARGLLIKSGSESRINLTSFQMLAAACGK